MYRFYLTWARAFPKVYFKKNRKKIQKTKKKKIILASFLAKLGRDRTKKRRKFFFNFGHYFYPTRAVAFLIKFKKLKNIILASFLAKPG